MRDEVADAMKQTAERKNATTHSRSSGSDSSSLKANGSFNLHDVWKMNMSINSDNANWRFNFFFDFQVFNSLDNECKWVFAMSACAYVCVCPHVQWISIQHLRNHYVLFNVTLN